MEERMEERRMGSQRRKRDERQQKRERTGRERRKEEGTREEIVPGLDLSRISDVGDVEERKQEVPILGAELRIIPKDADNLSSSLGAGMVPGLSLVGQVGSNYSTEDFGRPSTPGMVPTRKDEGVLLSEATAQPGCGLLFGEDENEEVADSSLAGLTMREASGYIRALWFQMNQGVRCKTMSTGKGLFPLPIATSPVLTGLIGELGQEADLFFNMCRGLNSLAGVPCPESGPAPSLVQKETLKYLQQQALRMSEWPEKFDSLTWDAFFRVKGVDYRGEEVLTARFTSWGHISPALPDEVGTVSLEHITELGVHDYVTNFDSYLLPVDDMVLGRAPKVMVPPEAWEELAAGLISKGICGVISEDDVFKVKGQPVLNGMFGVSKNEWTSGANPLEIHRLIMNLIPINQLCRGVQGDVSTLPGWASLAPLYLMEDEELVVSSEDVRCFFYIFKTPPAWWRFMAFNKRLPSSLCPHHDKGGRYYLCSHVLPMGFKNSVSIAQHIHRLIVRMAGGDCINLSWAGSEIRKDRPFSSLNPLIRVYLDNFDQLEKVDKKMASLVSGRPSAETLALRAEYERWGIPHHPKKSVSQASKAEVQGAIVDGREGVAYPRPEKLLKYVELAYMLIRSGRGTLKQLQVVGGGLVYLAMFRRPLLGGLNAIWEFIQVLSKYPPVTKLPLPRNVVAELARFISLVPLAKLDFRTDVDPHVTASDASTTGGGITVSRNLTALGEVAAQATVRGDIAGEEIHSQVLTIGLFDGIGALRVAVDALGVPCIGHISIECSQSASRVVEAHFPGTIFCQDVTSVTGEMVLQWACRFSQCSLVLLGAGPPCQGVSGLNCDRKGALHDHRSKLFLEVKRIRLLVAKRFPWAMVHLLMESVKSMDSSDRAAMSEDVDILPYSVDARGVSLARRPRLYWLSWEVIEGEDVVVRPPFSPAWEEFGEVELTAVVSCKDYLQPGWKKTSEEPFPTLTTSRPRSSPGRRPAGVAQCSPEELDDWRNDSHRFPPYQYRNIFRVQDKNGATRILNIQEREVIMGFPVDYTASCRPKASAKGEDYNDERLTLIGNSWNVTVVTWLIGQLFSLVGFILPLSPQECVRRTAPGGSTTLQGLLWRPPMLGSRLPRVNQTSPKTLVRKLTGLVSIKGEDILLSADTEQQGKYHRLRASIPARLWQWRTIAGWHWRGDPEHINVLELRAVLTTLKWRMEKCYQTRTKFVHLVDSQVVLHALTRGRSSSRKMRRTLLRINSLLLACGCYGAWTYVHTSQNPADRPSRRPVKKKWGKPNPNM